MPSSQQPVLGTSQFPCYPVYEVAANFVDTSSYMFLVTSFFNVEEINVSNALGDPAVVTSLLSAIKTWVEGYDWTVGTFSSATITEYDQSSADVTPA